MLFDQAGQPTREAIGAALKREGQKRALDAAGSEWTDKTLRLFSDWLAVRKAAMQSTFRFEEFREFCERQQWSSPSSHHVWGSLPALAARRGLIRFTGRYEAARSPKTHGHDVKVWESV
jgi:hypothetical protein